MKIPAAKEDDAQFEMAPMIDMVFLLLVFFMISSRMSVLQNIELEIPTASKAVVPRERPERFVVNITDQGDIFAGQDGLGGSADPVVLARLRELVKAQKDAFPDLRVYLRADQLTEHRHVKRVMSVMAEAGIDDFIFGAFTPDGGG